MEDEQLIQLKSKNYENVKTVLEVFNKKNADLFNFSQFHSHNKDHWMDLWRAVFAVLDDTSLSTLHPLGLNTVRILTRDELGLRTNDIINDLNCLLKLALLLPTEGDSLIAPDKSGLKCSQSSVTVDTIVEALKCICNLVFQNVDCRRHCVKNNVTDAIIKRVASSTQVELYDMKLLFLLTAFEPSARSRVQIDLNGIAYMTEWLDEKVNDSEGNVEQLDLLCEMLKVLFNITASPDKSPSENEIQSLHLTGVIRELLIRVGNMDSEKERNVVTHTINLLSNISSTCLCELIAKCDGKEETAITTHMLVYEGRNLRALEIILRYFHCILEEYEHGDISNDLIPPVLTVLLKCARSNSTMRHYIRSVVLPPLRNVSQRPEIGKDIRNYLCRFLTSPAIIVRDLTAELLFVCCKENVGRMIKYTGYGNAAGLFANRGLLDCRRVENPDYSSDSDDSDTEEYKQVQHMINPVLGCCEPSKHSPLDGMPEEQKEYEALELVKLMDKLQKSGVVQPCLVGEDGRPQPIDHILQMQQELPQQQLEAKPK